MRRGASLGAIVAAGATAAVGLIALMGASRIPVAEYLLFPGSMAAWVHKGDNYTSAHEFLIYAVAFGVPVNAAAGAILGGLLVWVRSRSK